MDIVKKPNVKRQLLDLYDATLREYIQENTPEMIKEKLKKEIDKERVSILLKLLGMEKRYATSWVVDHCNGRAGESAIGDYLRKTQEESIHELFDSIELTGVISEGLKKTLQSEYQRNLNSALKVMAEEKAKQDAAIIMQNLHKEFSVLNLLKTEEDLKNLVTKEI